MPLPQQLQQQLNQDELLPKQQQELRRRC